MESLREPAEFDVFGFKVRFKPSGEYSFVSAQDVVDVVNREAYDLKSRMAGLNQSQIAILVALKIASEKIALEHEFKESLDKLSRDAKDALKYIDEAGASSQVL